ncbi:MAG: beta-propeller domain-containing protein [Chthoniobacteraceae bacterium]
MNSPRPRLVPAFLILLLAGFLNLPVARADAPAITQLSGRSVWVHVPPGYEVVTLQQRAGVRLQTWRSLASKPVAEAGGTVGFVTKTAAARRSLRVIGKLLVPLPVVVPSSGGIVPNLLAPVFFPEEPFGLEFDIKGDDPNVRLGNVSTYAQNLSSNALGTVITASPALTLQGASAPVLTLAPTATTEPASEPVAPDIWKLSGDRLFFSNPLRGLQVFDMSQPDDPGLLGELRLPDRGAEIHLLDDHAHAVIITAGSNESQIFDGVAYFKALQEGVDYRTLPPEIINQGSGQVIVAELNNGVPRETGRAHFRGKFLESRLVGTKLYVVSEGELTSFDLSDPAQPVQRGRLSISGYELGLAATDRLLFLFRRTGYGQSQVDIIDISAPDGEIRQRGKITTAGDVAEKFSVALTGDVLTVVSNASASYAVGGSPRSKVETFSIANPDAPALLGRLEMGTPMVPGQLDGSGITRITATRFDGGRLYLSGLGGALRIIDLSTPAAPVVLGETSALGVVSYLEPLGDRLIVLGKVASEVAVSLFDVADPAHPLLLSQVKIGPDATWPNIPATAPGVGRVSTAITGYPIQVGGWTSEALTNEKALEILPEQGLILLPVSSLGLGATPAAKLQLIDLERDTLKLRGGLDSGAKTRRATVLHDRIIAVSATNLVTADQTDRDRPKVTSDVEIAWRSDHVFLEGEYLIQVGDRLSDTRNSAPKVTVSRAGTPDVPLTEVALDDYKVIGATARGGRLYVLQNGLNRGLGGSGGLLAPAVIVNNDLLLSVFDLTRLPKLTRLGKVATANHLPNVTRASAVWPKDDLVVWTGTAGISGLPGPIPFGATVTTTKVVFNPGAPASALDCDVAAYSVSAPAKPQLVSVLRLYSGNFGAFSAAFAADGRVFYSYKRYPSSPDANANGVPRAHRHFMRVIDFRVGNQPTAAAEVNVPGRLIGVSPDALRLYTAGQRYEPATGEARAGAAIHACDFRNGLAKLTGQLPLDDPWTPFAVDGETILLGSWVTPSRFANSHVQAWQTDGAGVFQLRSEIAVPSVERLRLVNHLLVGQWGGTSHFFDVRNPAHIIDLGERGDRVGDNLTDAAGASDRGLWVPLGDAGVEVIDLAR